MGAVSWAVQVGPKCPHKCDLTHTQGSHVTAEAEAGGMQLSPKEGRSP